MHPEVELKFQVSGFEELRGRLSDAGAVLEQATAPESNTILDDEGCSLGNRGMLLRLREYAGKVILTVKEPCIQGAMKNRMEHEAVLGASMGQATELFRALGYSPVRRYVKEREIWVLPGLGKVCLDGLPFGCFIEIEANTPEGVSEACRTLGLDVSRGSPESYTALEERHRNPSGFSNS